MDSIVITPKNEQEYAFILLLLKKMKINAAPLREKQLDRIPGVPSTHEELVKELRRVEAEHDPAACKSHSEVMKNADKLITEWR